jgi:hypothetical protein
MVPVAVSDWSGTAITHNGANYTCERNIRVMAQSKEEQERKAALIREQKANEERFLAERKAREAKV